MCGVAGFFGDGSRFDLERMTRALNHRGPDGEGFFVDPDRPVFLGHRRLAILDVAGGDQPMWNETGDVGVVYNGEIYNHEELRVELKAKGHVFVSDHSDTEVLVHGYEEWGDGLPARLNGMFAFAILDRPRRRLFLARDRFGEKPLYYASAPGFFAFASELAALAEHPKVSRSLNVTSLQKFFAWGYLPAPHAMLEGTAKLPGGASLSVDLDGGAIEQNTFWRFSLEPDDALDDASEPRLIDECASLIAEAARRRLMSDVPLGVFLSGGIDSSVVLASLAQSGGAERLKTFTISFEEASYDEAPFAEIVARRFGTEHHVRRLTLDRARDLIPTVLGRLDEPLGDASLLPTFLLAEHTREHVTVALSGDGGDELFAGYDPFAALDPAQTYARMVPSWLHGGARRLVDLLPISTKNMSLDFKLRRSLMGLSHAAPYWLPVWMAPLDPADARDVFEAPLDPREVYAEAFEQWESTEGDAVDRALGFFTQFYLQDDILMKVDRAAMMSSLETRAVFLDNDLVDFCRRLPNRFKFRRGQRKYLLKKVARRLLPAEIVDRKKKGFGVPLAAWLRETPATPPLAPLPGVRSDYAARAFAQHRARAADHRLFLWSWLSAQAFAERMRAPVAAENQRQVVGAP